MRSDLYVFVEQENGEFNDHVEMLYDKQEILFGREVLRNGKRLVVIEKDKALEFFAGNQRYIDSIEQLNDKKHTCSCCGSHTHIFTQDYRGDMCVSKYISCVVCKGYADEKYFNIMRSDAPKELLREDFTVEVDNYEYTKKH